MYFYFSNKKEINAFLVAKKHGNLRTGAVGVVHPNDLKN